jgi:hypothetical protein
MRKRFRSGRVRHRHGSKESPRHAPSTLRHWLIDRLLAVDGADVVGHDLLVVPGGLGHRSVAVTQVYLPTDCARIEDLIVQSDWNRSKKTGYADDCRVGAVSFVGEAEAPDLDPAPSLPGLQHCAA